MTWIPLTLSLLLTALDVGVTLHRMEWELNPLVKAVAGRGHPLLAALSGVLLIQASWACGLALWYPSILLVFLGAQAHRSYWQIRSLMQNNF